MKLIIEDKIPFIKGLLDNIVDVSYLAPDDITRETVRDADAMIIRTRTRCNTSLLDGSKCKFIATATIGTDHIDLNYCHTHGITVANAPGCNAPAVAQYVFGSLAHVLGRESLKGLTLGIVGVGHVGSIVERWGQQLGMNLLLCDPPRAITEISDRFVDIAEIAKKCDIITFHTPLTKGGDHPTYHLLNEQLLGKMKRKPVIINSARGGIVDTSVLVNALDNGNVRAAIIDCWEGEPAISLPLLERATVATPHIAGYSREGKIRATAMAVDAFTKHFGLSATHPDEIVPIGAAHNVSIDTIANSYSPAADTAALKASPCDFELLRNNYDYRHETPDLQ